MSTTARAAWLTVAAIILAAWGAMSSGRRAGSGPGAGPAPAAAGSDAVQTVRMVRDHRVSRTPAPPEGRRDPFRFRSAPARDAAATAALADIALQVLASAPVFAPSPRLTLAGLAESNVNGTAVRTAVLNVDGDVVLARVGDVVAERYRVARMTADAVFLEDAGSGPGLVLRLR